MPSEKFEVGLEALVAGGVAIAGGATLIMTGITENSTRIDSIEQNVDTRLQNIEDDTVYLRDRIDLLVYQHSAVSRPETAPPEVPDE